MAYSRKELHQHEEIVLDLRPHWWYFSKPTAALFASILLGLLVVGLDLPTVVGYLAGVAIIASVVWFGIRYVGWITTNFVLTTDRLISRNGVLSRSGVEIPLERINTVFFGQSIFERAIGSGDLRVESAGEQGTSYFTDIRRPLEVQNEIYHQMEANENRKYDRVAQGVSASHAAAAPSIADQIEQLDQLRQKGLITTAEFEAKKTDLLGRL